MRKLDLTDYTVKQNVPDMKNPGKMVTVEYPYKFKESILTLMFNKELGLNAVELLRQNILAQKIETCKGDHILLEEQEYDRVKRAVDAFSGFSRRDIGLVERINNAETIDPNGGQ